MHVRLAALALCLGAAALPAGWAAAGPDPGAAAHGAPGDRDHDHVSDDLQGRLARAAAGDRLDLIVTGLGAARAQRAVGRVDRVRPLPIVGGFAARMTAGQARALARTPGVRRVEADGVMHALDDGTDRDFGASLARSDTPGLDGSGVRLCVVDTGIDPQHEQVAPRTVTFKDFVGTRTSAYDDHGHGTHVAGIAAGDGVGGAGAATFRGVAPGATLYAAKVLDSSGSGSDSQVIAGIQWCVAQGVDVITMSLGDTAGGDGTDASSVAVDNAVAAGVVVVVAAGNSGDAPRTINYPGTARGAITVGAVSDWSSPPGTARHDDGTWLAAFSSRGPTTDGRHKPDLAGPGVTVTSAAAGTVSSYSTKSGTSMATPYVAGAVVLGLQAVPAATPAQVRTALESSALDVGVPGKDDEWGAGLVDVRAFVGTLRGDATVLRTPMPAQQHVATTIPTNGSVSVPVVVPTDGVGVPIGVTMTSSGSLVCDPLFGCAITSWSPDNNLELRSPAGTVVARSTCTSSGLSCATGRQETIGWTPTAAGTYTLRAYGKGGAVTLDVSQGPVGSTVSPPPPSTNQPPVAVAGPDRSYKRAKRTNQATFTLDGSLSSDPEGKPLTYSWKLGSTVVGSTAQVTLSRPVGTYTYTLTVQDVGGLTSSDSVTITVTR
ncbi:S8 family serine peptidase [Nocardioides marmoribigeumensis]|uniref:Serine protease AprX n=1 Tax=Nocardioides marmoribigeumensis TaxID=433649 RepID=A0ABU2BTB3_9ACTN|nr:S8 family serine peptidase [Nocardioides marmoribigeumensis]MDR7361875.1 serine protease AprX [Nocardioides marmoribigeumensis]